MAWQDEMVPLLRAMINDNDSPTVYSDTRLEELIVASAQLVIIEMSFDSTYTITLSTTTISPDPTSPRDNAFINLVSIKAAAIVYCSEAKVATKQSFSVTDGPSSVSTSGRMQGALQLCKMWNDNFRLAKVEYLAGNSVAGQAILSPYTQNILGSQDNFV